MVLATIAGILASIIWLLGSREPLRTYARDEVQRRNGLSVKDELIPIGQGK